jgi:hypothetical protein
MLSVALFGFIVTALSTAFVFGREGPVLAGKKVRAASLAEEGLEAVRSIRDKGFDGLLDTTTDGCDPVLDGSPCGGTYGLTKTGTGTSMTWALSPTSSYTDTTTDGVATYTRVVTITTSGNDPDPVLHQSPTVPDNTVNVEVKVTWKQNGQRDGVVKLAENISSWRLRSQGHGANGGLLVYGDGGTTSDSIKYRVLHKTLKADGTYDGTLSNVCTAADVDNDSKVTTKALRFVRAYSSPDRKEDIIISEHYDAKSKIEYIYSQVFDQSKYDTTKPNCGSPWSNVKLLSSWTAATFIPLESFAGTYLDNGDFMAIYSDNSTTPKFMTWTGIAWSATPLSMKPTAPSIVPQYIVASARPNTNEVMVAYHNNAVPAAGKTPAVPANVQTQYYNGKGYSTANWAPPISHSNTAIIGSAQLLGFTWLPFDSTKGGLIFVNAASGKTKSLALKVWTALDDGSGTGSWSSATATTPDMAGNITSMSVDATDSEGLFSACAKDDEAVPYIHCFNGSSAPAWDSTNPVLDILGKNDKNYNNDTGVQQSYNIGFQRISLYDPKLGDIFPYALGVSSQGDNKPQLNILTKTIKTDPKKGTTTPQWDWKSGAELTSVGSALKTVRLVPDSSSTDIMVLLGTNNLDLYTVVWNGTDKKVYSLSKIDAKHPVPVWPNNQPGKTFQAQPATNGSATNDLWYDFVWDSNLP